MNFKPLRAGRDVTQAKPIISDLNILTDGTTLRASLVLGSFTVKTESTAHPGGERSPRHAGPCPPRAGTAASAHRRASARHSPGGARTAPRRAAPRPPHVTSGPAPPGTPPRARGAPRPPRRAPRRGRSPVPPGGQQGLAQVGTQLPQRRLRVRHLQRPGPLLKPHPELHGGGGGRAQGPDPGGETLTTARADASRLQWRRPRSDSYRSWRGAEM